MHDSKYDDIEVLQCEIAIVRAIAVDVMIDVTAEITIPESFYFTHAPAASMAISRLSTLSRLGQESSHSP